MIFKDEIIKLIDSNLKTYQDISDRFIADYNRELELTKEYNGRQLLELLQNADDANSDEVMISWDTKNTKLTISNKGEPFSAAGIKSLMLANLSTKTKTSYIGNKGLGFRSILNWAEQINIKSNGCSITFSEVIAKDIFENQLKLSEIRKQELRSERNLSELAVPFPILAVPAIEENGHQGSWTTSIEIAYCKEFESDIESQLSEIREEILLFLNTIKKITIARDSDLMELHSVKETIENFELISIKDKKWQVFSRENLLPEEHQDKSKNEKQSYSLKVAFQEDLSDDYKKLFNFFPTQLSISLPCIIHGTFELNSSRNHLNDSKKNRYILKELVELFKTCILYLAKQNVDWRAYQLISPLPAVSDSKLIEVFYEELEGLKNTERIYPCIGNEYNLLEESIYYSDEFNRFFQEHFPDVFPELLIPLEDHVPNDFEEDTYEYGYLIEKIDELSQFKLPLPLRAELIVQLAKIEEPNEQERFSLLVNEDNNVIPKDDLTFTPVVRSEERFNIPRSVKVDFMNPELYDLLISRLEGGFDKKEPKSRELQRIIKSVVNLQPYDSNNVIDKIIAGTKDALKARNNSEDQINCIREMAAALYANFKNIDNRQGKLKTSVPLVSKATTVCDAENLYLGRSYPSGKLTEVIYDGMLKSDDYLAPQQFWSLMDDDFETIESFFLWLGVNKYSKITLLQLHNNSKGTKYLDFVFENGTDMPDNFAINRIHKESSVSKIERFDEIKRLDINKIILLVLKDQSLRKLLEDNDEKISWYYVNWRPAIITNFSYLRFQFLRSMLFTKYIMEEGSEDLNKLINEDFHIDYEFLSHYGINRAEVKSILIKLGAKESFMNISPENIYDILRAIPQKDLSKKGKTTQTVYKMVLESLVKQQSTFPVPDDVAYFSRMGNVEEYQPRGAVFYADNSILPKKILDMLPIINLPKRIGEDNVVKYFGIRSLKEFKVQINEQSIQLSPCDAQLNALFDSLKPYILAYRLESPNLKKRITDNDIKRKEARTLKQCRIYIVRQCLFTFGESHEMPVDEKEFINVKDTFYFKDSSLSTVDELKKDSLFCDAFAEMMCIIFKVNDLKNDFRQIFKNDIHDTVHLACQDLEKEKVEEAFRLLGISRLEIDFWKNVFELKGKLLSEPIENAAILKERVYENLGIALPDAYSYVDFENFNTSASYELINLVCHDLDLSVEQVLGTGLYNWHKTEFVSCIKDNEYKFRQLVWHALNGTSRQENFIGVLNSYSLNFITAIESEIIGQKWVLKPNYFNIIKTKAQEQFQIDLDSSMPAETEIQNRYKELLEKYNIEEADIADEQVRSLLFFNGNQQVIEEYLKSKSDNFKEGEANDEEPRTAGTIIDALLSKNGKMRKVPAGQTNGSWVHSGLGDKAKKRKGKKAELLVYNTLVDRYGIQNVRWVSGSSTTPEKNDRLHYDIEYKNEAGEWKFLEVKAISDNQFIISEQEKNKGISEPDKFEMALVQDNNIYMVKDLFKFEEGETFYSNAKFDAHPQNYVFTFDLNTLATS